ncbi:lipoyl(octanoyl) transferase LipB [Leptolyngbya cf. ectocarpi LEGE 11479]|uniref:Octanoyltransferase n=1 Tax=Leptolyngbya cf. ectocarpi LEGE 11479 TaxID=1828722 RepID=A0A928ZSL8_LEPEC|nr:lipoyl(octanoyl) transferase LipB [Leptolyngbya ectocarpi]MBE9065411.1 lipoyl(octanoyl) transferase LipB [Leptolyngbya cf. ectocarpi LEGE 11479]
MVKDKKLIIQDIGLITYKLAWQHQQELVSERKRTPDLDDVLILAEHLPVYTLGTASQAKFVHFDLADPNYEVHRIERGGEVTYHCPGQLVGYPILNLHYHHKDLHWYLRQLEEVIIHTLAHFHLPGQRIKGLTGVWVEGYKLAAIGIKVSRWITMHGFALNVCPDLSGFKHITPCGIAERPVGAMAQFIPGLTPTEIKPVLVRCFAEVFNLTDMDYPHGGLVRDKITPG